MKIFGVLSMLSSTELENLLASMVLDLSYTDKKRLYNQSYRLRIKTRAKKPWERGCAKLTTASSTESTITDHNALCLSPKILHNHCLQFCLGVKMAPRETENNAYEKFWGDKHRELWHVMVFSVVVN